MTPGSLNKGNLFIGVLNTHTHTHTHIVKHLRLTDCYQTLVWTDKFGGLNYRAFQSYVLCQVDFFLNGIINCTIRYILSHELGNKVEITRMITHEHILTHSNNFDTKCLLRFDSRYDDMEVVLVMQSQRIRKIKSQCELELPPPQKKKKNTPWTVQRNISRAERRRWRLSLLFSNYVLLCCHNAFLTDDYCILLLFLPCFAQPLKYF